MEGQMEVDFAKRVKVAVVNVYLKKREEHRVTEEWRKVHTSGHVVQKIQSDKEWWQVRV